MNSPFVLVIFGATGDLAGNKLIPALFSLFKAGELPKDFFIFGFARRDLTIDDFQKLFSETQKDEKWIDFAKHLYYQRGEFGSSEGYDALVSRLQELDTNLGACVTRIFYLATPPEHYEPILHFLSTTKLAEGCGQGSSKWTRIAIEKPFGKDVVTARKLDQKLAEIFEEQQIFRVDHYLGKETIQNLLIFRFANSIFEPIWNKEYIDHIQISWAETKGITGRGNFFDGVGILRDITQSHLMQAIAAVTMDMPKAFSQEGVRDARAKAIAQIQCIDKSQVPTAVVRGQYKGYKEEEDVQPNSDTETFVAMKFFSTNPRFAYVPFYLRAGKTLAHNKYSISVVFKQTCHLLFREIGCPEEGNILTFNIQPDQGITLTIIAKAPGTKVNLQSTDMHFTYNEAFGKKGNDAYEKILLDIMHGDQMLFNRSDELESSWEFITHILDGWEKDTHIEIYEKGSTGPKGADKLIEQDGRKWL